MVTANGDLIAVDEQHNADLFWAIRGGGPGFFGVITKYFLKVYPAPHAVTTTNYYFPLQLADEIGVWAGEAARRLPTAVELTVFHMAAPPPLPRLACNRPAPNTRRQQRRGNDRHSRQAEAAIERRHIGDDDRAREIVHRHGSRDDAERKAA